MSIEATIKTTRQVLERNLAIPPYQRPYRWTTKNVMQLLDDISSSMAAGKREYRIGSVICHTETGKEEYDIVDGQQRLTTIILVLNGVDSKLKSESEIVTKNLQRLCYKGNSVSSIRDNMVFIQEWLRENATNNGKELAEYILDKCKFVEIVVDDLGEAFQMFDTQNGRGKSLELYNLLKAYHIRAMDQNTQDERILCDRNWEGATQYDATPDNPNDPNVDILSQLFGEQLFKSRLWCRNENARAFTRDDIGEFKGFTIDKNHPIDFPFQNPFLLQYLTEKFYRNVLAGTIGSKSRLEAGETEKLNPFVNIIQPIINGKAFFEYIETYVELYKKMFIELGSYQLADFKRFFYLYCLTYTGENQDKWNDARMNPSSFSHAYDGAGRTGDTYLRESYKSLCFVLLDKFGEKTFLKYYKALYRLVYRARVENAAVRFQTAMSGPKKLFVTIDRAKNEADLLDIHKQANSLAAKMSEEFLKGKREDDILKIRQRIPTFTFITTGECHE